MSGSNPLSVALGQVTASEFNPVKAMGDALSVARSATSLKSEQFNLQQAQLQPGYQAMRMLMATNPNPSDDDVNAALGGAARIGGNVDGLVQNYTAWRARGGTAADFVRATSLGGMSPERQGELVGPQFQARQTAQGTYYGTVGGAWSPNANVFTPTGYVERGLSPGEATDMIQVGVNPDGSPIMKPRGAAFGQPYGGAPAGASGGGGGASSSTPVGPPPGSNIQPGTPMSQKDADLAAFATRESGNQNVFSRVQVPGYSQEQTGSGYYQIIPSTWAEGQALAGIPPAQRTQLAIQASPQQQYAVASALYDKYGGRPWAQSAPGGGTTVAAGPGGAQGGPFIGAASAQPVAGGGAVAQPGSGVGGNVRPAGGMQYFPSSPGGGGGGQGGAPGPYQGYTGLPLGAADIAAGNIKRQQALEAQMNAAVNQRATLEGMEADLYRMPSTGVATGAIGTIKNLLVQSGMLSQVELDRQAQGLSAQEQFDKFSAMLNQQLLAGMGGQATDARQELTGAATPSSVHSVLGNLGIIHMLEGNLIGTQVMGREFQRAVRAGQATPQQFDQWRDDFTKPGPNGARFDPRVFWIASMRPTEQVAYVKSLTDKDRAQLLKNANYAEQKGWVNEEKDGSMSTGY